MTATIKLSRFLFTFKSLSNLIIMTTLSACGTPRHLSVDSAVSNNGMLAQKDDFPSVVMLLSSDVICTGVHMFNFILTAAHCLRKSAHDQHLTLYSPHEIEIKAPGRHLPIHPVKFEIAPNFRAPDGSVHLDLAKVHLDRQDSESLAKNTLGSPPNVGDGVKVVGYGRTYTAKELKNDDDIGILRHGSNRIAGIDSHYIRISGPDTRAARSGEVVSYQGDSGGPLFADDGRVIGILRGGSSEGSTKHSNYTDITQGIGRHFVEN